MKSWPQGSYTQEFEGRCLDWFLIAKNFWNPVDTGKGMQRYWEKKVADGETYI